MDIFHELDESRNRHHLFWLLFPPVGIKPPTVVFTVTHRAAAQRR